MDVDERQRFWSLATTTSAGTRRCRSGTTARGRLSAPTVRLRRATTPSADTFFRVCGMCRATYFHKLLCVLARSSRGIPNVWLKHRLDTCTIMMKNASRLHHRWRMNALRAYPRRDMSNIIGLATWSIEAIEPPPVIQRAAHVVSSAPRARAVALLRETSTSRQAAATSAPGARQCRRHPARNYGWIGWPSKHIYWQARRTAPTVLSFPLSG